MTKAIKLGKSKLSRDERGEKNKNLHKCLSERGYMQMGPLYIQGHTGDVLELSVSAENELRLSYIKVYKSDSEDERRQGRGSEMLTMLKGFCAEQNIDGITLFIQPDKDISREAVVSFYEKNGFKFKGEDDMVFKCEEPAPKKTPRP